jgi:hypothetical protein
MLVVNRFSLRECASRYWLIFVAASFIAINVFFILGVTFGIPLSDEWRWLKELLIPLHRGEISTLDYLLGEYAFLAHSHYLALLFLWLDFTWFDLSFSYFTYIGVVFYVLAYGAILLYLKRYLQQDLRVNIAAILILSVGYFCITSDFPWLLVMFEYVYFFIAMVTLLMLDSYLGGRTRLLLLLLMQLVCLLLADTIGMAAVFISVLVLFFNAIFVKKQRAAFLIVTSLVVLVFALQYWFLGAGIGVSTHSRADTLLLMLHNPIDVMKSFMSAFCQPLVGIEVLNTVIGTRTAAILQLVIGVCGFILTIFACFFYCKSGGLKKSQLPLIFIGYSLLAWALIFISRYQDYGVSVIDEPRYARLFTLIYVGIGLAFLCMNHTAQTRKMLFLVASALMLGYGGTVSYKYWQDQYIESYFANAKIELMREQINSEELARYIGRCANDYCVEPVNFMKENKLSIFAE